LCPTLHSRPPGGAPAAHKERSQRQCGLSLPRFAQFRCPDEPASTLPCSLGALPGGCVHAPLGPIGSASVLRPKPHSPRGLGGVEYNAALAHGSPPTRVRRWPPPPHRVAGACGAGYDAGMKCPHCNREHDGHERTPGAFSATCSICAAAMDRTAKAAARLKPARTRPVRATSSTPKKEAPIAK